VSASWLACVLTLDRWVPKWTLFFTLFWAPSCATASSRPCGSDRIYLGTWMPVPQCLQFDQQRMLSRFFSLLLPPSPSSNGCLLTIMAKRKATAEELEAQVESNGYKRGAHREKDGTRDNGKHNKKTKTNQYWLPLRDFSSHKARPG